MAKSVTKKEKEAVDSELKPRTTRRTSARKAASVAESTAPAEAVEAVRAVSVEAVKAEEVNTPAETADVTEAADVAEETPKAKRATKTRATKKRGAKKKAAEPRKERKERIFALDIGTRSVIGIVAEREASGLKIVATERQEHKTRAMLDGQIHDVPQVAAIIDNVKKALVKRTGPLKSAAVAAAGRALYTMTADADMEVNGIITAEQERALDFAGVQAAQAKLAASKTIDDPTKYYCVGYSTIKYDLDGIQLKTLVGQRGRIANATVIATFLPRQVIDSMHSALQATKLDMRALTLEPIAAINVLIPPTMRHLNLVLVDIGAGTSDVAITKNGSVIAYGMVPQAGDEITEAISQRFLLDFNVAEKLKREAANGKDVHFTDILGAEYDLTAKDVLEPVLPNIKSLAEAISKQIMELNGSDQPQAVILVGGGALTPHLADYVGEVLGLTPGRVAVRHPEKIDGILEIPDELKLPDAVTPLGILKVAALTSLHFLRIFVNNDEYSLFNFRELTVSDALLNAGIQLKKMNGRPGLGVMLTINGENKFIPGTMGTMAQLNIDGRPATLDTVVKEDSRIEIIPGEDGTQPEVTINDVLEIPPSYTVYINGEERSIDAQFTINGQAAEPGQLLKDGDIITSKDTRLLGEVLNSLNLPPMGRKIKYTLNGKEAQFTVTPTILLNDNPATLSTEVHEKDYIEYIESEEPKLGNVLNVSELDATLVIYYEGQEHKIPSATVSLEVNGHPASTGTIIDDGAEVRYMKSLRATTTISDALLAVGFQPPAASSRKSFTIMVNKQPVNFTDPIKNGDTLEVILTDYQPHQSGSSNDTAASAASSETAKPQLDASGMPVSPTESSFSAPPMTEAAKRDRERLADKINSIPGLSAALNSSRNNTKSPFLDD
ncbi:Cell division protein FtsA [Anaerovibrio sp. JC8]|uniref:cell division FtsA domain-containing protein n=1 Tax=Anaerovibrio sp. JC8 TaxID=1240085 RepID=UPI000A0E4A4C|nr:cell division FtsA domain-containing protein [Anaerovibrio sp. JC8]ORU01051.1 Cell division protein FtsA [Anaerovibrio sp. JC8]